MKNRLFYEWLLIMGLYESAWISEPAVMDMPIKIISMTANNQIHVISYIMDRDTTLSYKFHA